MLVIGLPAPAGRAEPHSASPTTYVARLRAAIADLPVHWANYAGYDRSDLNLWITWPNGCTTRERVLIAESHVPVTYGSGCYVARGKWYSYYDAQTWRVSTALDIDHLVPLAEVWASGALRWNAGTRERYANDLGDKRSLVAVTSSVNRSKGDRDPSDWMPTYSQCRYVRQWVAVKIRWHLKVDAGEKHSLVALASSCVNSVIRVERARIGLKGSGGGGGGGGGSCDPSYPTICIPPPPPDLNCSDISYRNFKVVAPDDHHLDGDGDGVGCET